ncbi:MAG: minor capsid protein [Burkholderiales bacterium]|nr:minor capsid protein [Burkholderiales bacterium]
MPDAPPSLALAFGLPPEKAVAWFEGKGYAISWNWRSVADATAAYAFSVAGVTRADVLAAIRGAGQRALDKGTTLAEFKARMQEELTALGWWGPQRIVDLDTGETRRVDLSNPRRLETIYRTNLQSAYMAGRYQALLATARTRPFWQYIAVMDDRTRPSHAALNDRVYRYDDPVWQYIFPPNGYNCRCRVVALDADEMRQRGLVLSSSEGKTAWNVVPAPDGSIDQRFVLDLGGGVKFAPDVGFARNPALDAPWPDMVLPARLAVLGDAAGATMQTFAIAPTKLAAFRAWIAEVFADGYMVRNASQVLGYLDTTTMRILAERGVQAVRYPYEIGDRAINGRKRTRHKPNTDGLSVEEFAALPVWLQNPKAVLWDKKNDTLVYVLADPVDRAMRIKVIVQLNRGASRVRGGANSVRTVFRVPARTLLNEGQWTVLQGAI